MHTSVGTSSISDALALRSGLSIHPLGRRRLKSASTSCWMEFCKSSTECRGFSVSLAMLDGVGGEADCYSGFARFVGDGRLSGRVKGRGGRGRLK